MPRKSRLGKLWFTYPPKRCGLHTYEGMHCYFDFAFLLKPCCLAFSLLSCFLLLLGGCLVHQRLSSLQRLSSFSWRKRKGAEMDAPQNVLGVYIPFTYGLHTLSEILEPRGPFRCSGQVGPPGPVKICHTACAVSYTHLTLPTSDLV